MKRTVLLAVLAALAIAPAAGANTAADALNVGFDSAAIYRPPGTAETVGVGWRDRLADNAPVQANSRAQVDHLLATVNLGPGFHWWGFRAIYTVDSSTPYATVCLSHAADGSFRGWADYMGAHEVLMTTKVPVPTGPIPFLDGGADRGMTIWYPDANQLWEFYQFGPAALGMVDQKGRPCQYVAAVGQRMLTVGPHGKGYNRDGSTYTITYPPKAQSPGYWRQNPNSGPGSEFRGVARAATKLPTMFGVISTDEWNNPSETTGFGHMLSGQLPWGRCVYPKVNNACAPGSWVWPAAASDANGPNDPLNIQEGAVLRLRPGTNCQRGDSSLAWRRARAMCVTWRDYGWIGNDQTGHGLSYFTLDATNRHADDGRSQSPNWYWDAMADIYGANLEVLQPPAGKHDWPE